MRKAKGLLLPVLIFGCGLLSGCWDRREVNDIAIQIVTALDTGEKPGTYKALVEVAVPRKLGGSQGARGEGSSKPYISVISEGRILEEMTVDIERKLSRDLLSTHRRVFLIGEPLARNGLNGILDHITRSPEMRLDINLAIARDKQAGEMVATTNTLEDYPEEIFREIIKRKMKVPTTLRDFLVALNGPGKDPVAAAFSSDPEQDKRFILDSVAIFRKLKLAGFVSGKEAAALISILGEEPLETMKITLPEEKGSLNVRLSKMKVEQNVRISGGQPSFFFKVTVSGRIAENNSRIDLSNPHYIEALNASLKQEVEQLYAGLFEKLQKKYKADSAGLGSLIYKKDPKYWAKIEKDWPDMYPEQQINWEVRTNITDAGAFGAPSYLSEDEVKK